MNVQRVLTTPNVLQNFTARVVEQLEQTPDLHAPDEARLALQQARAPRQEILKAWSAIAGYSVAAGLTGQAFLQVLSRAGEATSGMWPAETLRGQELPAPVESSLERLGIDSQGVEISEDYGLAGCLSPVKMVLHPTLLGIDHGEFLSPHCELSEQGRELRREVGGATPVLDFVLAHEECHRENRDMDRRLAGGLGLVLLQEAARETPAESSARQLLDRLAAAEIEDCWRSEYQADRGAVQRMVESGYTLATATLAGGHLMSLVTAMRQADPLGNALAGSMVPLHPPEESRTRALQAPITMPAFYEELLEEPGFRETSPGLAVHPSYDWSGDGKPWRVSRARQHAEITPDGSVARLASIVVSGERTVTEDGEIIRETIHFEAGQPVWTRTSDQARHLYRNGQIEETCEWIEHPDGTRTTTTTHYQQGQPSLTRRETTGIAAEDGGPPWTEVETPDGPSRSRSGADFEERVEADGTRVLSWLHFLPQRHPFEPVPATLPNGIAVQVSGLREPGELEGLSKLPFGPDARVCLVDAIQRRIGPDGVEQRGVILARDPVSNIHYVDRRHLAHADSVYLSALIGVR